MKEGSGSDINEITVDATSFTEKECVGHTVSFKLVNNDAVNIKYIRYKIDGLNDNGGSLNGVKINQDYSPKIGDKYPSGEVTDVSGDEVTIEFNENQTINEDDEVKFYLDSRDGNCVTNPNSGDYDVRIAIEDSNGNEIASETSSDVLKIVGEVDSANDVTLTSDSIVQPNSHVPVKISITGLQDEYGNKINYREKVTLDEQTDVVQGEYEYKEFNDENASLEYDFDLSSLDDETYTFDVIVGDSNVTIGAVDIEVDTTAPTIDSMTTADSDADGKVEYKLTFSEPIDDDSVVPTDFDVVNSTAGDLTGTDSAVDDKVYVIESDIVDTNVTDISYSGTSLTDLAGNPLGNVTVSNDAEADNVSPVITGAVTSQSSARATLSIGETDGKVTVYARNEGDNKLMGAFGNNIKVKVVDDTDNDSDTTANYKYPTLTVELADNSDRITSTIADLATAISMVEGFSTSTYSKTDTVGSTAETPLSDGADSVRVYFSEYINNDTVNTADVNTDYEFNNAKNVTGTTSEYKHDNMKITIAESDAQILGDEINVEPGELEDLNGNEADTSPVTIEVAQDG